MTLETGTAIGGYSLSGQDSCGKLLPALAESYAWNFDKSKDEGGKPLSLVRQ